MTGKNRNQGDEKASALPGAISSSRAPDEQALFRRTLRRVTVWPLGVMTVLMLVLLGFLNSLLESARWVDHTHAVLAQISRVEKLTAEMETGIRGYRIIPDLIFLEPFERASVAWPVQLDALEDLVRDNAPQKDGVHTLRTSLQLWNDWATNLRQRVQSQLPPDAALQLQGKQLMDAVRAHIGTMQAHEENLLAARSKTLARVRRIALAGLPLCILVLAPFLTIFLRRMLTNVAGRYRAALTRLERERTRLSVTLSSIGDAVISTDRRGRVVFLNRVAEALTGWTNEEAGGQPLPKVFKIINEQSRAPVENPVDKVLREGGLVGLANHTLLIARDGRETTIADSAAPILSAKGETSGVVLVFRDQTAEREAMEALLREQGRTSQILESITDGFYVVDAGGRFVRFNSAARKMFAAQGVDAEALLGQSLLEEAFPDLRSLPLGCAFQRTLTEHVPTEMESFYEPWQRWYAVRNYPTIEGGVSTFFQDITERKRAQEALQASEARFRAAIGAVSSLLWTNNAHGMMEGEQPGWAGFTGQSREEYQGYGWSKAVHPEDAQPTLSAWEKAVAGKTLFEFEHRLRRHDGEWRLCSIRAVPVLTERGDVGEWVGVHSDITERKQSEAALRDSAAQQIAAISAGAVGTWNWNLSTNLITANPALLRIFGLNPDGAEDGLTAETYIAAILSEDQPLVEQAIARALAPGSNGVYEVEYRVRPADGNIRWVSARGQVEYDAACQPSSLPGALTDITHRKQAEEQLRRGAELLTFLVDHSPCGFYIVDAGFRISHMNADSQARAFRNVMPTIGRRLDEAMRILWPEPLAAEIIAVFRHTLDTGEPYRSPGLISLRQDLDTVETYEWQVDRIIMSDGSHSVVCYYYDTTPLREAERSARASEERYRSLVSVVTDVPWVKNAEGAFVAPQPAWSKYTGQSWEEYRGMGWMDVLHPENRAEIQSIWENACRTRTVYQAHGRMFHAESGEYRHFVARAVPLLNSDGTIREWVGSCMDCHEEKIASQKLERTVAERTVQLRDTVQQLETFSYSIVHDMRAPLRAMRSFAVFLQNDYSDRLDETARDYLARINSAAGRLDALITDVLSFSRVSMEEAELQPVNLDLLLKDLVEQYPQFQEAAVNIHIQGPLPVVLGNSVLLTQVFSNLMGNALKFFPPGGEPRVTVRAENVDRSHRVRVWVEDNGIGIPPEHRQKIFGLFQRLHRPEEYAGTGVGLAIMKKAVERMGGMVGVESEVHQGSRFWFELDAAPSAPSPQ